MLACSQRRTHHTRPGACLNGARWGIFLDSCILPIQELVVTGSAPQEKHVLPCLAPGPLAGVKLCGRGFVFPAGYLGPKMCANKPIGSEICKAFWLAVFFPIHQNSKAIMWETAAVSVSFLKQVAYTQLITTVFKMEINFKCRHNHDYW